MFWQAVDRKRKNIKIDFVPTLGKCAIIEHINFLGEP